jgi:hypothetical protein
MLAMAAAALAHAHSGDALRGTDAPSGPQRARSRDD